MEKRHTSTVDTHLGLPRLHDVNHYETSPQGVAVPVTILRPINFITSTQFSAIFRLSNLLRIFMYVHTQAFGIAPSRRRPPVL